jgi:hypothetical protein
VTGIQLQPVVHVVQVEHTGTQVHAWPVQPANGLQAHVLVLQTLSQVHTILHVHDSTGTHVHTELQEHVPLPVGAFSLTFMMYISLSGIFRLTDLFTEGVWADFALPDFGLSSGGLFSPIF